MSAQPFGKYQLLRKLATGGMAEVWLAQQTGIEDFRRSVVIKRILPHLAEDAEFVQMFLNEAKIAARFSHPNIAQIFDLGRENGSYFIAMEYVHGEDLGRIMRKAWSAGQWLTKPLALRIIAEACQGLFYAHERVDESTGRPLRVVHRDVSPQNILVSFEGSVKLVDFGIAKAADQASLTRSGAIKGKFAYMSPEQASGKPLDHRSDIFALGLVLYELLTGVRPIKRENDLATLQAALECAIDAPSTVLRRAGRAGLGGDEGAGEVAGRPLPRRPPVPDGAGRCAAAAPLGRELGPGLGADEHALQRPPGGGSQGGRSREGGGRPQVRLGGGGGGGGGRGRPHPTPHRARASGGRRRELGRGDGKGTGSNSHQARTAISRPDNPRIPTNPGQEPVQAGDAPGAQSAGGELESWEAPPGVLQVPKRRPPVVGQERASTGMRQHAARSPSSPDVPAVPPQRSRDEALRAREDSPRSREDAPRPTLEPSPRGVDRKATRIAPDADEELEPEGEDVSMSMSRPSTRERAMTLARPSTQPGADTEPPEAPVRRARTNGISRKPKHLVEAEVRNIQLPSMTSLPPLYGPNSPAQAPVQGQDDVNAFINVEEMRKRSQQRFQTAIYVSVAFALVLLVFLFRQAIVEAFSRSDLSSQGVLLTVTSSPTVEVFVKHPEEGAESQPVHMGQTPLKEQPGAHLGDTVILESKSQGIHYEETLKYGTPGSVKEISKHFQKGSFILPLIPKNVFGLAFYMGDNLVGRYTPGVPVDLIEGDYNLELRGIKLKEPLKVKVKIVANQNTELTPINIRDKLVGGP